MTDDAVNMSESGNTPIRDKATQPDVELNRLPNDARIMETPEVPKREQEVLDSLDPEAKDVSQFDESINPETATLVDSGEAAPRVAAANDPAAELKTMMEQSKADVYVPNPERVVTERGNPVPAEDAQKRELSSGQVNRINPNVATPDTSVAMATSSLPDAIPLPAADES